MSSQDELTPLERPKRRAISKEELKEILDEHRKWLESGGSLGSRADLSEADLRGQNLGEVNLRRANLREADLSEANLSRANLSEADLKDADLSSALLLEADLSQANLAFANLSNASLVRSDLWKADLGLADLVMANLEGARLSEAVLFHAFLSEACLYKADMSGATLEQADLDGADFQEADLTDANLSGADLTRAHLVGTKLSNAILSDATVYGISVWDVDLKGARQLNLVITPYDQPAISLDNLEIAQFVYLLLHNERIRDVVDTIARKLVLILGRFTPERKAVLNALRDELRQRNYVPVLFDFDKPASRDLTETVRTLAHLARFVVADLTEPTSIPQELQAVVPDLAVPVQPILMEGTSGEYGMFADLRAKYHWVLPTYAYVDLESLIQSVPEKIIEPAEAKAASLAMR